MSAVASPQELHALLNVEEAAAFAAVRHHTDHNAAKPGGAAPDDVHMSMRRRVEAAREYRCTHVSCTLVARAPCFTYTAPGPA